MLEAVMTTLESAPGLRSHWHPYGFIVTRLPPSPVGTDIRLHIWPDFERRLQRPEWPIHSHPWDLRSRVLAGTLDIAEYSVSSDPEGPAELYRVDYDGELSQLTASGEIVRPKITRKIRARAGDLETLTTDAYHTVDVDPSTIACTLVETAAQPGARPSVVGERHGPRTLSYERVHFPVETVRKIVASLRAA